MKEPTRPEIEAQITSGLARMTKAGLRWRVTKNGVVVTKVGGVTFTLSIRLLLVEVIVDGDVLCRMAGSEDLYNAVHEQQIDMVNGVRLTPLHVMRMINGL